MPEVSPETLTPALMAAAAVEIALLLAGLAVLWRFVLSPAARAAARAAGPLGPWEIPLSDFFAAGLYVIGGGLGLQFATAWFGRSGAVPALTADADLWLVIQGAAFQLGMLAGAAAAVAATRTRDRRQAGAPPPPLAPAAAGALTFLAVLPVASAVALAWNALLTAAGIDPARQELVDLFVNARSPAAPTVMTLFAVVVAPVTEELVFRAGLFRYLRTRAPRWVALGLPAVLFAGLHGNLAALAPLAALGVAFALAYERTGRIAVPIVAHALFNLNTILLLLTGVTV